MKTNKRLRHIERRLTALEATRPELPPANIVKSKRVDVDTIWRASVNDYTHGWEDEEHDDTWNRTGYL